MRQTCTDKKGKRHETHAAYSYDRMNRLTEERRETDGDRYDYDLDRNRTRNQLTKKKSPSGITEYVYDGGGCVQV